MPWPLITCIIGLVFAIVMAIIGGLLTRSIRQIDEKLDANCDATAEIKADMQGYKMLVDYLRTEVVEVKGENRSLRDAHHAIDKHIAVQKALHPNLNQP